MNEKSIFLKITVLVGSAVIFISCLYLSSFQSAFDLDGTKLQSRILVFNAVQKTGSTSLYTKFHRLSKKLNFDYAHFTAMSHNNSRQKGNVGQSLFRKRVLRPSKKPTLTVQEIHFVHFPKIDTWKCLTQKILFVAVWIKLLSFPSAFATTLLCNETRL